jgi:hypothetical protein
VSLLALISYRSKFLDDKMSLVESDGVIEDGIWEKKLVDELGQSLK